MLWACSDKFDPTADYEENVVILALLDPSQTTQYVKINKVFTNKNNSALTYANIADSIFFDSIAPVLTEIETGRTIPLYKTNVPGKANGVFLSDPNYLYTTNMKIHASNPVNMNEYYHYSIDLTLPKTGKKVTAVTDIPDSVFLLQPATVTQSSDRYLDFPLSNIIRVSFQAPYNSKIFDAIFYFNYIEVNKQDTNIKTFKSLQFPIMKNYRVVNYNTREAVNAACSTTLFYDLIEANIKPDNSVFRRFDECKLEIAAANSEFDNFMQTGIPSIGIVQKQTDYTNVVNGFGLFASRRISRYNKVTLGPVAKNRVMTDVRLKGLGFVN